MLRGLHRSFRNLKGFGWSRSFDIVVAATSCFCYNVVMQKPKPHNFGKFVFIALFGAMALTAFRLVSKPTNLLQGVLAPLPFPNVECKIENVK